MIKKEVLVLKDLLGSNKAVAKEIREQLSARGILVLNLISSPGAGKTSLLEALAGLLRPEFSMAVIEGDIETERDAERIRAKGIPAWQITTGGACHLEAKMIGKLSLRYRKGWISCSSRMWATWCARPALTWEKPSAVSCSPPRKETTSPRNTLRSSAPPTACSSPRPT